jgi:hypothetical protein
MGVSLSTFLNIAAANLDTLLAALIPQRGGSGKLFSSDSSHDPFPHCLKAVLVQSDVHQLSFKGPKQEEVQRRQVPNREGGEEPGRSGQSASLR